MISDANNKRSYQVFETIYYGLPAKYQIAVIRLHLVSYVELLDFIKDTYKAGEKRTTQLSSKFIQAGWSVNRSRKTTMLMFSFVYTFQTIYFLVSLSSITP